MVARRDDEWYELRTGPDGRLHETIEGCCRAWGITTGMLDARMEKGWPIKDALTLPKHTHIRTAMRKRRGATAAGETEGRGAALRKDA